MFTNYNKLDRLSRSQIMYLVRPLRVDDIVMCPLDKAADTEGVPMSGYRSVNMNGVNHCEAAL